MSKQDCVVVGIDGSAESGCALQWAAGLDTGLGPIRPVMAWQYPWWAITPPSPGVPLPPPDEDFHERAQAVANEMLANMPSGRCLPPMTIHGAAGPTLVEVANDANLLVVGTRGRGAIQTGLLGSVSNHVVNHANVPVVVVPSTATSGATLNHIVVGVDGSGTCRAALIWALENAPSGATVEVVNGWVFDAAGFADAEPSALDRFQKGSEELVGDVIERCRSQVPRDDIEVEAVSVRRDPRLLLRQRAKGADLLVVGTRSHSGLSHLLLGSVASSLVHQPEVPTLVLQAQSERD